VLFELDESSNDDNSNDGDSDKKKGVGRGRPEKTFSLRPVANWKTSWRDMDIERRR